MVGFYSKIGVAITLCSMFFMASCIDPRLNEAGARVAGMVGSTEFDARHKSESTGSVYELSVSDASWNGRFSNEDVLSTCALAFFNQIAGSESTGFIRIILEGKSKSVQQTFTFAELQQADRCIDRVNSFFNWKPELGMDSIRLHVDPIFFPDSLLHKIGGSVREQDSLDNQFVRAELIGFETDTVANLPVLTIKVKAIRKQSQQRYDAFIGAKSEKVLLVVPAED